MFPKNINSTDFGNIFNLSMSQLSKTASRSSNSYESVSLFNKSFSLPDVGDLSVFNTSLKTNSSSNSLSSVMSSMLSNHSKQMDSIVLSYSKARSLTGESSRDIKRDETLKNNEVYTAPNGKGSVLGTSTFSSSVPKLSENASFEEILNFNLYWEGGYVNDPDDFGGATNMGVIQTTYDTYRQRMGLPKQDVANITKTEAVDVYETLFYKDIGLDKVQDKKLALAAFNAATAFGPQTGKQILQESGGNAEKCVELIEERLKRQIERNPSQAKFQQGWANRFNDLRRVIGV